MALPVFGTVILGVFHRETVEEELHQWYSREANNHNVFRLRSFPRLFPSVSQVRSECDPPPLGMLQVSR